MGRLRLIREDLAVPPQGSEHTSRVGTLGLRRRLRYQSSGLELVPFDEFRW